MASTCDPSIRGLGLDSGKEGLQVLVYDGSGLDWTYKVRSCLERRRGGGRKKEDEEREGAERRGEEAAGRISKDKDQTLIKNVFKKNAKGLRHSQHFLKR